MPLERFLTYDAEEYYRKRSWLLGSGKCGGKAKGLAFAHDVISESELLNKVELPAISHIVSTEVFEDFLSSNGLDDLYDEENWETVKSRFEKG